MNATAEQQRIEWETSMYGRAGRDETADVSGNRLRVMRAYIGARYFRATINGVRVDQGWSSMEEAKAGVIEIAKKRRLI